MNEFNFYRWIAGIHHNPYSGTMILKALIEEGHSLGSATQWVCKYLPHTVSNLEKVWEQLV
jgi:hypothetical protein